MNTLSILFIIFVATLLFGKEISVNDINKTETNSSQLEKKNIEKAIKKEQKYKKEQKFYLGDDYNLSEHKINPKSLNKIKVIEPDYDFDMTDVYAD